MTSKPDDELRKDILVNVTALIMYILTNEITNYDGELLAESQDFTDEILDLFHSHHNQLLKELLAEMPENHQCDKSCDISSNEWVVGHRAYKDAESNVLDEVTKLIHQKMLGEKK